MGDPEHAVPPARVHENRWDELDVPPVGALGAGWTPHLRVSVVIPVWNDHEEVSRCLAALTLQTYPHDLLEAVIADDGSDPPVTAPDVPAPFDVRVVRHAHVGFGAGRTRNLGAAHARGDVLLFLDADMLLDPRAIEAHMRWHHVACDVVTLGRRRHAEFSDLTSTTVLGLGDSKGWRRMIDSREQWAVEWIDTYMADWDRLLTPEDEAFRLTTGANVAVNRDVFIEVGGFGDFRMRGIEDTEFGYRLWNAGAVLIWDVDALGWHDGRSFFQGGGAQRAIEERRASMAHHLPTPRFRRPVPGRSYAVPWLVVHMAVHEHTAVQVTAAVEALLQSERHDLVVHVIRDPDGPHRVAIDRALSADPRVRIDDVFGPHELRVPLQVWVPPSAVVSPMTLSLLAGRLSAGTAGIVRATVPELAPARGHIRMVRTRAWSRAKRLAESPADVDRLIAELFGEQWVVGADVGVRRVDEGGRTAGAVPPQRGLAQLTASDALRTIDRRLSDAEARIGELEARQPAARGQQRGRASRAPSTPQLLLRGFRRVGRVRSVDDARRLAASVRRRLRST